MGNNYNNSNYWEKNIRLLLNEGLTRAQATRGQFVRFPQAQRQEKPQPPAFSQPSRSPGLPDSADDTGTDPEGQGYEGRDNTPLAPTIEANQADPAYNAKAEQSVNVLQRILEMNQEDLLRGIVLSEVLGRPKARKRGRW